MAISAAAVALLALLLAVGAQIRLARVRRDFAAFSGDGTTDIARVAATQNHRIDRLTTEAQQALTSAARDQSGHPGNQHRSKDAS
ncbi:hypothetical protein GCM10027053_08960 [Intrasporangium mesophilum]